MNARTCLLCGKTLSRIWVGAGEDFCSREHRNQYRLRRGMDRLQEANKVASLMRRRENPKPIPVVEHCGDSTSRMADTSRITLTSRKTVLILPASKWAPSVRPPRARDFVERYETSIPDGEPRDFGILRHPTPRLILSSGSRSIQAPGANYQERIKQPLELKSSGRTGQVLRVSAGAGFRLPKSRRRIFRAKAHAPAILCSNKPRPGTLSSLNRPTAYTTLRVEFTTPELVTPSSPVPVRTAAIGARGAIPYRRRVVPCEKAPVKRVSDEQWTAWTEAMPRPIRHAGQSMVTPQFVTVRQKGPSGDAVPNLVLVPLMPQDMSFGYTKPVVIAPARPSLRPRATVEEQFDSGLKNWIGGVGGWVLDAAGARTGPLAILSPTLDKRDYELEFLARIENRSVTWVFRAANLNEYHVATVSAIVGGGYEFRRGSVIGGVRATAVTMPLRLPMNRKNAINIHLRAVENEFEVSLDGQVIDTWTDSRLPVGGIGFLGVPEDRARIYWVRLSLLASPGKEYPKR